MKNKNKLAKDDNIYGSYRRLTDLEKDAVNPKKLDNSDNQSATEEITPQAEKKLLENIGKYEKSSFIKSGWNTLTRRHKKNSAVHETDKNALITDQTIENCAAQVEVINLHEIKKDIIEEHTYEKIDQNYSGGYISMQSDNIAKSTLSRPRVLTPEEEIRATIAKFPKLTFVLQEVFHHKEFEKIESMYQAISESNSSSASKSDIEIILKILPLIEEAINSLQLAGININILKQTGLKTSLDLFKHELWSQIIEVEGNDETIEGEYETIEGEKEAETDYSSMDSLNNSDTADSSDSSTRSQQKLSVRDYQSLDSNVDKLKAVTSEQVKPSHSSHYDKAKLFAKPVTSAQQALSAQDHQSPLDSNVDKVPSHYDVPRFLAK